MANNGTLITQNVQIGNDINSTNNFTIRNPDTGNVMLSVGNSGATTLDVIRADNAGDVFITGNITATAFVGNVVGNVVSAISLIGDVSGSGTTGANLVTTLATVNSNTGTFGNSTYISQVTVNSKGLVTAISNVAIPTITNLSGPIYTIGANTYVTSQTGIGNIFVMNANAIVSNLTITGGDINNVPIGQIIQAFGAFTDVYANQFYGNIIGDVVGDVVGNLTGNITGNVIGNVTGNLVGNVTGFASNVITNANLTGDVTSIGNATTLATVNGNTGQFGDTTHIPQVTVNAKGLITSAANIGIPNSVKISGDATSTGGTTSSNAVMTLNTVNSNVGTFGNIYAIPVITVNAKGLVTAVSTNAITGNIALIGDVTGSGTTGANLTTTLSTVNSNTGEFGDASHVGQFTVNNKGLITSASNVSIPNTVQLSGDVTSTSGTTSANAIVTLNTVNANTGQYGDSTHIPQYTVNAKGLITGSSNVAVSFPTGSINVTGGDLTMSGSTGSNITNATLSTVNSNTGEFGDASHVGQFTVNGKGLITSASNVSIPNTVQLSGDVTSTSGTTSSNAIVTLNTVNTNTGQWGDATHIPQFTVNGKGLVTSVSNVSVTIPSGSITVTGGDLTMSGTTGANITNATLATVNSNIGQYGDTTHVSQITVNTKGLVTSAGNVAISFPAQVYPGTGIPLSTGSAWSTSYNTSGSGNVILGSNQYVVLTSDATANVAVGSSGTITLATVNSNTGMFGDTGVVPQIVVNGKGLITQAANVSIPNTVQLSGDVTSTSGTTSANAIVSLNTVNSNIGMYGDASNIPQLVVNSKGLITSVSNVAVTIPSGNITVTGSDLTMSGSAGSNITNATLNTVNSDIGVFGNTMNVAQLTVNAKGLITAVSNVAISAAPSPDPRIASDPSTPISPPSASGYAFNPVLVIGDGASATADGSLVIGNNASATGGGGSIVIGQGATNTINATQNIIIGKNATDGIYFFNGVLIGTNSSMIQSGGNYNSGSVGLGVYATTEMPGELTFGSQWLNYPGDSKTMFNTMWTPAGSGIGGYNELMIGTGNAPTSQFIQMDQTGTGIYMFELNIVGKTIGNGADFACWKVIFAASYDAGTATPQILGSPSITRMVATGSAVTNNWNITIAATGNGSPAISAGLTYVSGPNEYYVTATVIMTKLIR